MTPIDMSMSRGFLQPSQRSAMIASIVLPWSKIRVYQNDEQNRTVTGLGRAKYIHEIETRFLQMGFVLGFGCPFCVL